MKLAQKLKQFREEKDITQEELAKRIGVSTSAIADAERGKRPLSKNTAMKLSEYSKMTVDYWVNEQVEYYDVREDFKMIRETIIQLKEKGHISNGECDQMARQMLMKAIEIDVKFLEMKGTGKK